MSKSLDDNIVILNSKTKVDENANSMTIEKLFDKDYVKDLVFNKVLKALRNDDTHLKNLTLNDCKKIESRLYYRERKYVSTYHSLKLRLLKLHHDSLVDDHQKRINIYELLTRNYYWNEIQNFVRRYCNHCNVCRRSKSFRFKKQKVLRTLFISQRR